MRKLRPVAAAIALLGFVFLQPANLGCGDCGSLEITTDSLPDASVGQYYDVDLASHCGGDDWYIIAGQLPPGIGLLESGSLRGTPAQIGNYQFTLEVVDYDNYDIDYASKGFALTVRSALSRTPTPTS